MLRHRRRWQSSTRTTLVLIACLLLAGALQTAPTAYAATVALSPSHDSYIRGGSYWTNVYGTQTVIEINNSPDTSASYDRRGYLKFDVSGVSGTVSSATLQLYVAALPGGAVMVTLAEASDLLSGSMSTTSWTESNLTRQYEPTRGATITTEHVHTQGQLLTLDVTTYVQQQADGDNVASFLLVDDDTSDNLLQITSKEGTAANAPVLSVTTGGEAEPPVTSLPTTGTNNGPFFQVPCAASHISQDDPIVYPGQDNAAHEHQFFGNTTTNENSTLTSLLAGSTTCTLEPKDTAAYWAPTLYDAQGNAKGPYRVRAYYYAHYTGSDRSTVLKPFPQGLKVIAGKATATGAQPDGVIRWLCRDRNNQGPEQPLMSNNPPMCDTDQYLSLMIRFPNCVAVHSNGTPWLDSSDHQRHMAYAEANQPCPSSHPMRVPKLRLSITYETNGGYSGGNFTLGGPSGAQRALPWYGMHADFFNSWDATRLSQYVTQCLINGSTSLPAGCSVVLNAP